MNKKLLWQILFVGFFLRIYNLFHGLGFHPDERQIAMVAERLSGADLNPHFFAYGSFPIYLLFGLGRLLGTWDLWFRNYDGLMHLGRTLSAVSGTLTIAVASQLSFEIYRDKRAAILSSLFLALCIFHIQLSRFFAVDILLTLFVALALLYMVKAARRSCRYNWLMISLFMGCAMATKVAGATLFLPLATLGFIRFRREGSSKLQDLMSTLLLTIATAVLVAILLQPYFVLDFQHYLHDVREQIEMVKGNSIPPYTLQYQATSRWTYHLWQMANFTLGWPLFILALGSLAYLICTAAHQAFKGALRRTRFDVGLIAILWLLAFYISIAPMQVKFPRYLLPIYPVVMILSGVFASRLISATSASSKRALRWLGRAPVSVVIASLLVSTVAFMNVYSQEHVWIQASRWIFENISPGSKILGEHWDDRLPLRVSGRAFPQYANADASTEMPLYERDSPEKFHLISERLASANAMVLATPRLYGVIPRLPERFPLGERYYKLLFSGELGYEAVQTFEISPRIGPLVFRDVLLDESLSVYDHPKVIVFKKTQSLSSSEIFDRITANTPAPNISRDEMMVLTKTTPDSLPRRNHWTMVDILLWFLVIELLGWFAWPILSGPFALPLELSLGLSKLLGFLSFGYVAWMAQLLTNNWSKVHLTNVGTGLIGVIGFGFLSLGFSKARAEAKKIFCDSQARSTARWFEIVFWASVAVYVTLRGFQSDITWGERPMDFSFLNFFARSPDLPAMDPWGAGHSMSYYYLGFYIFGLLTRLTGLSTSITYNLASVTVFGLLSLSIFSFFRAVGLRELKSALATVLTLFCGNWAYFYFFAKGSPANFNLFWQSSRVFESPGFSEYPLWSFLFNDLHPHVIALPIGVALLSILVAEFTKLTPRTWGIRTWMFAGFLYGSFLAMNLWDFLFYGPFIFVFFLFLGLTDIKDAHSWGIGIGRFLQRFIQGLILLGAGLVLFFPMLKILRLGDPQWHGWYDHHHSTLLQETLYFGHWALPSGFSLLAFAWAKRGGPFFRRALISFLLAASVIGYLALKISTGDEIPRYFFATALVLVSLGLATAFSPHENRWGRLGALFISFAALGLVVSESVHYIDRMNLVFKSYILYGTLMSLGSCLLVFAHWSEGWSWRPVSVVITCLSLVSALFAGSQNIFIMAQHRFAEAPRPSFDGTLYMHNKNPEEAVLFDWMNRNIGGTPALIESVGEGYSEAARGVMFTGLPSVLGWEYHVSQRGLSRFEINERKANIEEIYTTPNAERANALAKKYNAQYILLGTLETNRYPGIQSQKFLAAEFFEVAHQVGGTLLIRVR